MRHAQLTGILKPTLLAGAIATLALAGCHRDLSSADHLARGKELADKGDHRGAVIEFKNVLQSDGKSLETRYLLGRELLAQGDVKNAEIELQKAFDGQYDIGQVLPLLVKTQLQQGEMDKVTAGVAAAKGMPPTATAELQTLLGSARLSQNQPDQALAAFHAATQAVPDYPEAQLGIARVTATRGDIPGATRLVDAVLAKDPKQANALALKGDFARASGDLPKAIEFYEAAIKEDPRNFLARLSLTGAYIGTNHLDLAQQQVDELKKQAPRQPGVNYMDALIAFNKKDFARANDAIAVALNGAPSSGSAQLLAGAIANASNQPVQAEAHLRDALKSNPGSVYARKLLAGLYVRQRDAQKADEVLAPALVAAPNDEALIALAGEVAVLKGDFPAASQYFDKAGKLNPNDGNARTKSAAIDFARGDEAAGFAELEAASKASPGNANPDIALILARIQRKQFDQALVAWKTLEKRQPDNPVTYNLRAAIDLGKQDEPSARKALEHAIELQPKYFPAVANLAALDERANNVDGARQRYKTLLAKDPGNLSGLLALAQFEERHGASADVVLPLIKEARRANPQSETPVLALTRYYVQKNDPKQALAIAQEGLASSSNSPTYMNLVGQLLMQTGSTDQGLALFRKAAAQNPGAVEPQMRLGLALVAANQPDAAVQSFQAVFKAKPEAYGAEAAAVGSLIRSGHTDQAIALMPMIRQQSPKSPLLPELEGDVKLATKQYGDAAALYRKVLTQSPSPNLVIKTHTALYLSGDGQAANSTINDWLKTHPKEPTVRLFDADLALRAKDYPRATQDYRTVLETRPDDPVVLNNLAWTLSQQKDPQAIVVAQKAMTIAPNSPEISDTLGWLLVEKGETRRGLELLQKANAAAPARREIALHLAKAQIKDGKKDAARSTLQGLVDVAPDSIEGKESRTLLTTL